MSLQLRRGTETQRLTITPAEGELIYVTDTKKVYVGDGVTVGGILVGPADIPTTSTTTAAPTSTSTTTAAPTSTSTTTAAPVPTSTTTAAPTSTSTTTAAPAPTTTSTTTTVSPYSYTLTYQLTDIGVGGIPTTVGYQYSTTDPYLGTDMTITGEITPSGTTIGLASATTALQSLSRNLPNQNFNVSLPGITSGSYSLTIKIFKAGVEVVANTTTITIP